MLKRNIEPGEFSIWHDETIHATGLELKIDLSGISEFVTEVTINFDWDKFREIACARQLPGMDKHPLLSGNTVFKDTNVNPNMDVEVAWKLNQNAVLKDSSQSGESWRLELATAWMERMNKRINEALPTDYIISRWHVEIDGDNEGRYLSMMSLISYFQFTLNQMQDLNEILEFISKRLQVILMRSNRVIQLAESTATLSAA